MYIISNNFLILTILCRLRQEEADRAFQANTTPYHHHVQENEDGEEEGEDEAPHSDVTKDLTTDESIIDPVEERRTLAERNERLHDQLKVSDYSSFKNMLLKDKNFSCNFFF